MFNKLDHKRRPVLVPRRVVRAIAGYFNPGTAAVVLAAMVRGMFWRKQIPDHVRTLFDNPQNTQPHSESSGGVRESGVFRIDNRTKREWIVEVFGISPRTVTISRKTLIELGWLIPQDAPSGSPTATAPMMPSTHNGSFPPPKVPRHPRKTHKKPQPRTQVNLPALSANSQPRLPALI